MGKIVHNRFLDAFLKLMLLSAAMHIAVLAFVCIARRDVAPLNFFSIISLDVVFPGISEGFVSQIASLISIVCLYGIILFLSSRKK